MSAAVNETHEIGDAYLTSLFQFIDPLRGKVPLEDRVDLGNSPKHNGSVTFVQMPTSWPARPAEFPHMLGGDPEDPEFYHLFHKWIQERGIYTLAYSDETFSALLDLDGMFPAENFVVALALELYPSASNKFLARAHGRPGTYTSGCRGPLCRAANTVSQRNRYMGKRPELERQHLEDCLMQVRDSYEAYLWYIKWLMKFRRGILDGGNKTNYFWSSLDIKGTILIDCTDESEFLE